MNAKHRLHGTQRTASLSFVADRNACNLTETKREADLEQVDPKSSATETTLSYRPLKPDEAAGLCAFVLKVFTEFVAPLYQDEGVDEFRKFVTAKALADRLEAGNIFVVAENGPKTIGVIEMRENRHIALLFVDATCQRQGVAGELIRRAVALCWERAPDLQTVTVNSSPNAFAAYRRLGFRPTGEERTVNGIRFIPMALPLEEDN